MLKYLRCYCSKIPELRNLSIFLRGLIIVSSYTFQNHWSRGKRQKSKRTMTSFEEVTKPLVEIKCWPDPKVFRPSE